MLRVNGLRVECNKFGFTAHRLLRQQLLSRLPHYTRTIHQYHQVFQSHPRECVYVYGKQQFPAYYC